MTNPVTIPLGVRLEAVQADAQLSQGPSYSGASATASVTVDFDLVGDVNLAFTPCAPDDFTVVLQRTSDPVAPVSNGPCIDDMVLSAGSYQLYVLVRASTTEGGGSQIFTMTLSPT